MQVHLKLSAGVQTLPMELHHTHSSSNSRVSAAIHDVLQDALLPMLRKQPTLLYRNVSDLRTRMTVLCQTLRLPPESLVSLLVHNNTLMIHYDDIAPRVDYLKKALGLPGEAAAAALCAMLCCAMLLHCVPWCVGMC
jgi:hypothetical protein